MDAVAALQLRCDPARPAVIAFTGAGGKSSLLFRLAHELVQQGTRVILTTTTLLAATQCQTAAAWLAVEPGAMPWDGVDAAFDHTLDQALTAHGQCLITSTDQIVRQGSRKQVGLTPMDVDRLVEQAGKLGVGAILVEADGSRMHPVKAPAQHEPAVPACATHVVAVAGIDAVGRPLTEAFVHRPAAMRATLQLPPDAQPLMTPAMLARLLEHPHGGRKHVPIHAHFFPFINKVDTPPRLATAQVVAAQLAAHGTVALLGAAGAPNLPLIRARCAPWTAVILAAGGSRRMGAPKQVAQIDGKPLVIYAVQQALAAGAAEVLVVTGAYGALVEDALAERKQGGGVPVRVVHNAEWQSGQASSMHAAVRGLAATMAGALFLPVDQPFVPVALLRRLVDGWQGGASLVAPEVDGHLRGAPCFFDRSLFPELMAVQGDVGGRAVLQRHAATARGIPTLAATLDDIDTPQQLDHAKKISSGKR